jgi:penicillin-binding protein 1A
MAEKKQSYDFRKLVKWFWLLVLSVPVGIFLLFFLTSSRAFWSLPSIEDIANPPTKLASQIISSDGVEIGKFFLENRTNAQIDELSPDLVRRISCYRR